MGHVKAVKDVTFSNDGRRFLSCGYDRQMKLWDTETGQCIKRFSNGKIPYVVKFHPDEDKQNIFLAGMSDKKIIQVCSLPSTLSTPPNLTTTYFESSTTSTLARSYKNTTSISAPSTRSHSSTRIDGSSLLLMTKRSVLGTMISLSSSNTSQNPTCTQCLLSPCTLQVRPLYLPTIH